MDSTIWKRSKQVFHEALEKTGPQRMSFVAAACGEDRELRAQVEALLAANDEAGGFLASLTMSGANEAARTAAGIAAPGPLEPGTRIGPYKLLQLIGEGGFGAVYMAEQQEPVRRKVALKVIKLGMDTKQVIARFEAERQALAMMEHPNIARVLDAGATDKGRPYFVMELVKGIPITEYCDKAQLSTTERLDLFISVCSAIQHAHQKGIIHRDVKPSNVMLTLRDGKPVPKVIDFGIAKATDHRLTEKTLFTEYHQFVGTPAYMSPEQAEMSELDIDTRTDIYSLGVLLYELLTGTTPFESDTLRNAAYAEIQRIIRDVEPPKPSTRLSTLAAVDLALTAQRRKIEATGLSRLIRGDLDWIVMKALEKDRTRRYDTARELAADVEHHLANEPILASPPAVIYKCRKFVKRNRVAAAAGSAVAAALVVGLMLSTIGFVQADQARNVEAEQRKVAVSERDRALEAEQRALRAKQEARRQAYVANVIAAGSALSANEVASARRRLQAAPEEFRNWEWRYLNAETDHSLGVLRGHGDRVLSVAFSPDGTRLASASDDKTVRLWDPSTGNELAVLRGHVEGVLSVAFSPDGTRLASASIDKTIRLWEVSSGQELFVLRGHESSVYAVALSPDGARLASASGDRTVRLWDASTGEELAVLRGHEDEVNSVAFSPDGTHLASAADDRTVRLWDVSTGEELAVLTVLGGYEQELRSVAFSPDGARLALASWGGTLHLWDLSSRKELAVLRGHGGPIRSVAFSPDGTRLASGSRDSTVRLWDASSGKELAVLRHGNHVHSVAFSPDGTRLASASSGKTVRLWDLSTGEKLAVLRGHEEGVNSVAFSPDGARLASPSEDKTVRLWDVSTGEELAILRGHEDEVNSVAFSPDGTGLASASQDSTVRFWDPTTGKELAVLRGHEKGVTWVAFSPDGTRLASASWDRTIRLWDPSTGKELAVLRGHETGVYSLAFSPDGTRLASSSGRYGRADNPDNTVRLWDVSSGQELAVLRGHVRAIWTVVFSPDGTQLASASYDRTVRLWDASNGEELAVLRGHEDEVNSVAFSLDGTQLASASDDTTVRLWDVSTGEELAVLRGHEHQVYFLAFSPDGVRLASASRDKTVRLWDTVPYLIRHQERQAIFAAKPEAERMVDKLRQKSNDWTAVAQRLREDTALSAPLRRAALNNVLRRAIGHP